MEQKKKFSYRLNLFDSIVILIALAVGGVVLAKNLSVENVATTAATTTIRYVVRMDEMQQGTGKLVCEGGTLVDAVRNYQLGTVISAEVVPATRQILDEVNHKIVTADVEGYEDVYAVVESVATHSESEITLDGGYVIRVGGDIYIKGEGYMSAGYIVDIIRDGV